MEYYDEKENTDTDKTSAPAIAYLKSVSMPIANYLPTPTEIYYESRNFSQVYTLTDPKNLGWASDFHLWDHAVGDAATTFIHEYYILSGLAWIGLNESYQGITINTTGGDFPRTPDSYVDLTVHYTNYDSFRAKLYVAGELQTLPDRPWIPGPFYVIRKTNISDTGISGADDVYAIWSPHISWPVAVAGGGDVRGTLSGAETTYVVGYKEGGKISGMSEGQMRKLAQSNPENIQIKAETAAQMAQANAAIWQAAATLAGNIATISEQGKIVRPSPSARFVPVVRGTDQPKISSSPPRSVLTNSMPISSSMNRENLKPVIGERHHPELVANECYRQEKNNFGNAVAKNICNFTVSMTICGLNPKSDWPCKRDAQETYGGGLIELKPGGTYPIPTPGAVMTCRGSNVEVFPTLTNVTQPIKGQCLAGDRPTG